MLLKWLDPQLEELAVKLVPNHSCPAGRGRPFMPTREQLKASGHGHLVSAIQAAGGFLEVRSAGRPFGAPNGLTISSCCHLGGL